MAVITFAQSGQRKTRKFEARAVLNGFFAGQVTTSSRYHFIVPCDGRILAVNIHAAIAGSGSGSTQVSLTKNGVGITSLAYAIQAANTGYFVDDRLLDSSVHAGDVLELYVNSVPTISGHSNIAFTIVIG